VRIENEEGCRSMQRNESMRNEGYIGPPQNKKALSLESNEEAVLSDWG
jgi:hypothetical protein